VDIRDIPIRHWIIGTVAALSVLLLAQQAGWFGSTQAPTTPKADAQPPASRPAPLPSSGGQDGTFPLKESDPPYGTAGPRRWIGRTTTGKRVAITGATTSFTNGIPDPVRLMNRAAKEPDGCDALLGQARMWAEMDGATRGERMRYDAYTQHAIRLAGRNYCLTAN